MELEYDSHEGLTSNLELALRDSKTSRKVIVVRGAVTRKHKSFEEALLSFTGNAQMECQSSFDISHHSYRC